MTAITKEQVAKVARLAKLQVPEEELEGFTERFGRIVAFVSTLSGIPTEGVEPLEYPGISCTPLREDKAASSLSRAEALANAPQASDPFFEVPRVVE